MDSEELIRKSFNELMKSIATSVPGHVVAFDEDTQLAQVQIGIKYLDIRGEWHDPPIAVECPVYMPGGIYHIECQIDRGVEGLIVFSQRCIDGWRETGGVASNPILRTHSVNDALFFPGMRSKSGKLSGFQNNGIRLSNADGTQYIWLKNDGDAEMKIGKLKIDGNCEITGNTGVTGDFVGGTVATAAGIDLDTHTHSFTWSGPSGTAETAPPTP